MLKRTCRFFSRLLREDDGPTTTEYAILLALIILVSFLSIQAVGVPVQGFWQDSGDNMNSAITANN